ncbi:MAG TPA: phosphatase PAP2 family protein [Allosphingosinicella sp.]
MNEALFHALNGLVGRSWLVDSLVALALDNLLVKAGPICACFLYAWYRGVGGKPEEVRRRILLLTLASLFLIAPLSKTLSEQHLAPRPFLMGETSYVLADGTLAPHPAMPFNTMQSGDMMGRVADLGEGRVASNDLVTFPSDHAAFFISLALGIFLACRRAGAVALGWAIVVTLGSRVAAGLHWPLDIAAGGLLGAAVLLVVQFAFAGRRGRVLRPVVGWTFRYPGLAAALLFLALLEAANTMQTLKRAMEIGSSLAERLL